MFFHMQISVWALSFMFFHMQILFVCLFVLFYTVYLDVLLNKQTNT